MWQHSGVRGVAAAYPVCPCGPHAPLLGGGHPWVHVGPHTGGPPVGFLGLSGCVRCREWNASGLQDVRSSFFLRALSLSLANKMHLDALESFWPINTRTCLPKLQSRIDWSFLFFIVFPSLLARPRCHAAADVMCTTCTKTVSGDK